MRNSPENFRGRQKSASARPEQLSGDHSAVAPPVPIPNTEVKRCSPDGSASIGCARVGRCQNLRPASWKQGAGLFLCHRSIPGSHFSASNLILHHGSRPHPDDAAIPAAPRECAGRYLAALPSVISTSSFMRTPRLHPADSTWPLPSSILSR